MKMKKRLQMKLFLAFIGLGLLVFLLVSSYSSTLVASSLTKVKAESLYEQADKIATACEQNYSVDSNTLELKSSEWDSVARALDVVIWVSDADGQIVYDSNHMYPSYILKQMDLTSWGGTNGLPSYAGTGDFSGYFSENYLTVVKNIHVDYATRGYVLMHYNLDNLADANYDILNIMYYTGAAVFALAVVLLLIFWLLVSRPLHEIIHAADEYASGNLKYRCKVNSNDELGYLSATLNYMTEELCHSEEYQRQFISNMSHDFRSPLTSIRGFLVAIQDGTIPQEMHEKYLGIVIRETERLNKLTEGLLTLNQLNAGKGNSISLNMSEFDMNQTIKDTCATFEGRCKAKNITFKLKFTEKEMTVRADFGRIQQVIYNLIDNALKFSNQDSHIDISTRQKNGKVFVSVKDYGCGIPKEHQKKIFDRFYKADNSRGKDRQGTGLGLAIVKEIITAHEQNIDLISTPDVGTEFVFTLQKAKED